MRTRIPRFVRSNASRVATFLTIAGVGLLSGLPAMAQNLAFTLSGEQVNGGYGNYGYSFTANQPIIVSGLSFNDVYGDGLDISHQVGLWNNTGSSLLTSATVTNADPYIAGGVVLTNKHYRWYTHSIAPLTLPAGTYVIGGAYPYSFYQANMGSNDNDVLFANSASAALGVSFGNYRYVNSTDDALHFPSNLVMTNVGAFGPNFVFTPTTLAPEPGTLGLLGLMLPAIAAARRRALQSMETSRPVSDEA